MDAAVLAGEDASNHPLLAHIDHPNLLKRYVLFRLAETIQAVVQSVRDGDEECSLFLGEMLPFLAKERKHLEANQPFRKRCAEIERARIDRKPGKEGSLRSYVYQAIVEANSRRMVARLLRDEGIDPKLTDPKATVMMKLPDLCKDDEKAIRQWTEKVVYPYLKGREAELRSNPAIGNLRKATGKGGGKFQLSRLKVQIEETVKRLAALPKTYYFRLS